MMTNNDDALNKYRKHTEENPGEYLLISEIEKINLSRIYLMNGENEKVINMLPDMITLADKQGLNNRLIRMMLILTKAYYNSDGRSPITQVVSPALVIARSLGRFPVFSAGASRFAVSVAPEAGMDPEGAGEIRTDDELDARFDRSVELDARVGEHLGEGRGGVALPRPVAHHGVVAVLRGVGDTADVEAVRGELFGHPGGETGLIGAVEHPDAHAAGFCAVAVTGPRVLASAFVLGASELEGPRRRGRLRVPARPAGAGRR